VAKNAEAILALVSHELQCYAGQQAQLETADDGTMAVDDLWEPPPLQFESGTQQMSMMRTELCITAYSCSSQALMMGL
jgi:hypothetical protein